MKVLFICSSIPSHGIHYYAAILPIAMKNQKKIDVAVLSSPGEAEPHIREMLHNEGIEVIDFPESEKRGWKSTFASAKFLATLFKKHQIDIIHTFGFASALRCWLGQYIHSRKKKIPIIISLESIKHGRPEEFFVRFIASQMINLMPCQLCALSSIEYKKMKKAGIRSSKLKLVPNWLDVKKFEKSNNGHLPFENLLNGKIIIVYLAQFTPRKGHFYLLKAANKIVKNHLNCLFVLAGDGPLLPKIRSLAYKLNLMNHVIFPGRLSSEEVVVLLKRSDIGVIASLSETFGWAIVEPLMANKPVVTTAVGYASDLANINGVLMVPRRNANALAIALKRMIEDPELRENIAKQGKKFVLENCDINKIVDKYYSIYSNCV